LEVKAMASATDIQLQAFVGGSATLMARIVGASGANIVQADIASIAYSIFTFDRYAKTRTGVTNHTAVALTVANVVFNTLQTDAIWTVDATGYNFRHVLDVSPNAAFAAVGTYLIEYKLTPNNGEVIIVRFAVTVI
jgi:hypothetical protein